MSAYRCDDCGRFCSRLNDVWCNPYWNGIDREVCDACTRGVVTPKGVDRTTDGGVE